MEGFKDYKVLIEDLEDPPKDITKSQLIAIINKKIKENKRGADTSKGVEIDVKLEWKEVLQKDGSILWEYTKLGWKAMHYQQRDQKGNIKREWLSFKSLNYKGKKK